MRPALPQRFALPAAILASLVFAASAHAADPQTCAPTDAAPAGATPAPGAPCFMDVRPYPFGADGNPVADGDPDCLDSPGVRATCYLQVDSLAFRAWNRGLAATSPTVGDASSTTAFGVWLFNGVRWFPDPTFPGQSVCRGNKVLWAGKRDYWLVGSRQGNWPALCRFDGVSFEWQPVDVPSATLARVPLDVAGRRRAGAISAGACNAWDDCWFFGGFGTVVHWNGQALSDATPDVASQPWLGGDATAAVARRTAAGAPFGLVTRTTGGGQKGDQLPPRPDGSPPPELFGATGGAFAPLPLVPPSVAQPGDPYRTDLVAVDADPQGRSWAAGRPVGDRVAFFEDPQNPGATDRRVATSEPSPLLPANADGTARPCPGTPPDQFRYANQRDGEDAFLWSSIAVLGDTGAALAGGQMRAGAPARTGFNDDDSREPVLALVRCDAPPVITRFRATDPTATSPSVGPVAADRFGTVTAVAAAAGNDAWTATTRGRLLQPSDPSRDIVQAPHLYRMTDGLPPNSPAGDDDEPRPLVFQEDPPIIVEAPPDPEPEPVPDTTTTQRAPPITRQVRQKASVYGVRAKLRKRKGELHLEISFKLRRPVTLGVEALRRDKVVSRSPVKRFTGKSGTLTLRLSRKRWPTRIRFVLKATKPAAVGTPARPAS